MEWKRHQTTLRAFDRLCLQPVELLPPEQIQQIRESSNVRSTVFAARLNASVSTIRMWEIGQRKPIGVALRLLCLVQARGLEIVV